MSMASEAQEACNGDCPSKDDEMSLLQSKLRVSPVAMEEQFARKPAWEEDYDQWLAVQPGPPTKDFVIVVAGYLPFTCGCAWVRDFHSCWTDDNTCCHHACCKREADPNTVNWPSCLEQVSPAPMPPATTPPLPDTTPTPQPQQQQQQVPMPIAPLPLTPAPTPAPAPASPGVVIVNVPAPMPVPI